MMQHGPSGPPARAPTCTVVRGARGDDAVTNGRSGRRVAEENDMGTIYVHVDIAKAVCEGRITNGLLPLEVSDEQVSALPQPQREALASLLVREHLPGNNVYGPVLQAHGGEPCGAGGALLLAEATWAAVVSALDVVLELRATRDRELAVRSAEKQAREAREAEAAAELIARVGALQPEELVMCCAGRWELIPLVTAYSTHGQIAAALPALLAAAEALVKVRNDETSALRLKERAARDACTRAENMVAVRQLGTPDQIERMEAGALPAAEVAALVLDCYLAVLTSVPLSHLTESNLPDHRPGYRCGATSEGEDDEHEGLIVDSSELLRTLSGGEWMALKLVRAMMNGRAGTTVTPVCDILECGLRGCDAQVRVRRILVERTLDSGRTLRRRYSF